MTPELIRFQIEIARERLAAIEDLMRRCNLESRSDVFNAAVTLFAWAVAEAEQGKRVGSIDQRSQRFEILQMEELQFAARNIERR